MNPSNPENIAPSQTRLQRLPDFTGGRLNHFRQVFLRHGLPGLLLGLIFLLLPGMWDKLLLNLAPCFAAPYRYVAVSIIILGLLSAYAVIRNRVWSWPQFGWIFYLAGVSAWEEWVFRLALPYGLTQLGLALAPSILISNVVFGAIHYFTLRWKLQWCFLAFLGGLAFSNQMQHGDLMWVIGIHWVATFLNTPRPPGGVPRAQ